MKKNPGIIKIFSTKWVKDFINRKYSKTVGKKYRRKKPYRGWQR